MQKLTKEQAQWLIKKLKDSICLTDAPDGRYVVGLADCFNNAEKIINQCTEKEFPEIHMRPKHAEDIEEVKVYTGWCDGGNGNCIVLYSHEEYTHFNNQQFKQFTEGCQAIVRWIEEQE